MDNLYTPRALRAVVTLALAVMAGTVGPTAAQDLKTYAQKAVVNNPEVTARYNALRGSLDEIDVARGAYYPRFDLLANTGRERSQSSIATTGNQNFTSNSVGLELNQILWDGLATYNEVRRLGHGSLVRFFEFMEASEIMALEAARAYYDVQRFRELVVIAESNYIQHKQTFDQIEQRFKSGVGRGVDMEQAAARLALADSNLVNETSNLHDVNARFQRIIGEPPGPQLQAAPFPIAGFPASREEAVKLALLRQAGIIAATENVRSVQAQLDVRRSTFQPKLEARVRDATGRNLDGSLGGQSNNVAELVLSWNLFNGGSDMARVRQFANALNNAKDLRDKSCRDVRQTLSIAYNDAGKLVDLIKYLTLQVQATEKARDAYRKQFDIGQRSLLDLLNSENELYQAKRALINANYDREIAYARVHNATGGLLPQLGLSRIETGDLPGVAGWVAGDDSVERCPAEAVSQPFIDKAALDAKARSTMPIAVKAELAMPLIKLVQAAPSVKPEDLVIARLLAWASAWSSKSLNGYFEFYSEAFKPAKISREAWLKQRTQRLEVKDSIKVTLTDIQVKAIGADQMETRFQLRHESGSRVDQGEKVLLWQQVGDDWFIVRESGR
jgi:adhesin transport system outer membrane protein